MMVLIMRVFVKLGFDEKDIDRYFFYKPNDLLLIVSRLNYDDKLLIPP